MLWGMFASAWLAGLAAAWDGLLACVCAACPAELRAGPLAPAGHISGGMKRVPSAPVMRRPPSSGRLADHYTTSEHRWA